MKFSLLALTGLLSAAAAAAAAAGGNRDTSRPGDIVGPARCIVRRVMVNDGAQGGGDGKPIHVCEMDPEYENDRHEMMFYPFDDADEAFSFDDEEIDDGAVTSIFVSRARRGRRGGKLRIEPGAEVRREKINMRDRGRGGGEDKHSRSLLRLSDLSWYQVPQKTGESTLLFIHVTYPGEMPDADITQLNGIAEDIYSIFSGCAGSAFSFVPASGPGINEYGVLQVAMDTGTTDDCMDWQVIDEANVKAADVLGLPLSNFDHVLQVTPAICGIGIGIHNGRFAAINSIYPDTYARELGHNFGLMHSGLFNACSGLSNACNDGKYGDRSCIMGYSHEDKRCFNGAKSWELGWYSNDNAVVNVTAGEMFDGHLVGAVDWANDNFVSGSHKVVVKILDPSQELDYFVMFNRAKDPIKPRLNFAAATDKVTVTTGKDRGNGWQHAVLGAGEGFSVDNFAGSGKSLAIHVTDIHIAESGGPDTARVLILLLTPEPPTRMPTASPSSTPSMYPSGAPSGMPSASPSSTPSKYPSGAPSGMPSAPLPPALQDPIRNDAQMLYVLGMENLNFCGHEVHRAKRCGGHLASVTSQAEKDLVDALLVQKFGSGHDENIWLGGYQLVENRNDTHIGDEDEWSWSDGSPWTLDFWENGQPDNFVLEVKQDVWKGQHHLQQNGDGSWKDENGCHGWFAPKSYGVYILPMNYTSNADCTNTMSNLIPYCPPGYYSLSLEPGSVCQVCPDGTYSEQYGTTGSCPAQEN